ncbi:florfenicol exporter, putative [Talaromyces stipitatus ATCC 10500]|uniref:Florfenicol exporter, putative n=1 Tax=Talaromyces stipitatus (strain ATCC 10500 / CBS 375.48 / QM 6759 / NRRL 1006) TaxID=441959 RepID=B8M8K0_TALSN|nr:florfenicol exporter, putative [Talaromyces stipitatus ATCC 10500]EED20513.1 florfenicol exporter, putative [Talaromyces stipitatus ATCC 10500]
MAVENKHTEKNNVVPTTESTNQVVLPTDQDHVHHDHDHESDSYSDSYPGRVIESTATSKEVETQQNAVPATGTEAIDLERSGTGASSTVEYSIFSPSMKRYIVIAASCAGFFSPISSQIYFPAMNTLAKDLSVSISLINLTMTSYMIFQGIAPVFIGDFADNVGRRPAYFLCFVIYLGANVGLALQNSYAALFVLRCMQSAGSSTTIALSAGVIADVASVAERGSYMGFVTAGSLLGPALGPVIGGLLSQYLGWRAIFWFLFIIAAVWLVQFIIFYPETGRKIVGNGSIPPPTWNMSLIGYLEARRVSERDIIAAESTLPPTPRKLSFPNPLPTLAIVLQKDTALLLITNSIFFAGFYDVAVAITSLYQKIYGLNDLEIGLCYLPFGAGSALAAFANGKFLDFNYRRIATQLGLPVQRNRHTDLKNFPIEKARLQIAFPLILGAIALIIVFGWVLDYGVHLTAPTIITFFMGFCLTGSFNTVSTLLVDIYPNKAATATAGSNITRCLLGAGATAVIEPMLTAMGTGWCYTFIALVMLATTPLLFILMGYGPKWREERRLREEAE